MPLPQIRPQVAPLAGQNRPFVPLAVSPDSDNVIRDAEAGPLIAIASPGDITIIEGQITNINTRAPLVAPTNEYDQLQNVGGFWGVEPSLTAPVPGDLWTWDGTLWRPRAAGLGNIQPFVATAQTVGLWPLSGDLSNTVDPSNPFTVPVGNEVWADIVPGKKAFYFDGSTRLILANFVAALAITGDMTAYSIWQFDSDITATLTCLLGHGGTGETQAVNVLYSMRSAAASGTPPRPLLFTSESGAGVNADFSTLTASPTASLPPVHQLYEICFTRISSRVQFYVNGKPFGILSPVLTTPDGGGSGRFQVGSQDTSTLIPRALCWGVMVENVGRSAAEMLAVYNSTLGQGFGTLS